MFPIIVFKCSAMFDFFFNSFYFLITDTGERVAVDNLCMFGMRRVEFCGNCFYLLYSYFT